MKVPNQDRHCFIMLRFAQHLSRWATVLRFAQQDRTGFGWELSLSANYGAIDTPRTISSTSIAPTRSILPDGTMSRATNAESLQKGQRQAKSSL